MNKKHQKKEVLINANVAEKIVKVKNVSFENSENVAPVSFAAPEQVSQNEKPSISNINSRVRFWEKVSRSAIFILVFLLPLFFLPWTSNVLDFNKQFLLIFLVFIALIAFISKTLNSFKFRFNSVFINLPVLIFLPAYGLSTVFSLYRYGSFWGFPLNISSGFVTVIFFILLYFLISNIFSENEEGKNEENQKQIIKLLFLLILSGFFAAVFGIIQLFGKFFLPWDFAKNTSFNTIGTVNSLALFLAILLPLTISFAALTDKLKKIFVSFCVVIMMVGLAIINFQPAWIVLMAGSAAFFIFSLLGLKGASEKKSNDSLLIKLSMILLIISLFFIIFKFNIPSGASVPIEVYPSHRGELGVAKETLFNTSFLTPVFGTGPGTFVYNFSKFKPQEINNTIFWNIRFESGASEVLDKLITTGILGVISLFFIFGSVVWLSFKYLKNNRGKNLFLGIGVISALISAVFAQFFYPFNVSLFLIFWVCLAVLAVLAGNNIKTRNFEASSSISVILSFVFIFALSFGAIFFFMETQKYFAEKNNFKALKTWQKAQSVSDPIERESLMIRAIELNKKAIALNQNLDLYWRDISQLYFLRFRELTNRADLSKEELKNESQILVVNAIDAAKRSTDFNQNNVANWSVRGFVYKNLIGFVKGVDEWAIKSYQKAQELEPSPYFFNETGLIYLLRSDLSQNPSEKEENINLALQNFEKAIELKNDYASAHFQIAMSYVRQGKVKEAIDRLELTKLVAPRDTGLAFQLGIIYYQDKQFDKAEQEFERAVGLDQNYSNARYFLGLVYDQKGEKSSAIEQFQKIQELNPDNEEVKKILINLKEGRPILEGIQPAQPPIQEGQPESIEKK